MAVGQKKRESKKSNGSGRGAKPTQLTDLQKVLLGTGAPKGRAKKFLIGLERARRESGR